MHTHSHFSELNPTEKIQQNSLDARKVTVVGMVLNIILSIVKVFVGLLANSSALVADGIHSVSDLITDILVLFVTHFSSEAPDAEHPYGHGRFETLGTVVLGSLLIAVAGGMLLDSIERLLHAKLQIPGSLALWVAIISVLSKEWLFRYTRRVGKKIHSKMIEANAWHHRSDAFSSIVVVIGILGSMMGISWFDPLAELIVSLMVAKVGWDLAWSSMKELVDTALSEESTQEIRDFIKSIEGVRNIHELRSRHMGSNIILDVHIQVSPAISVSEGHQIGLIVTKKLRNQYPHITDITFHIDAEDDHDSENELENNGLPPRSELLKQMEKCWSSWLSPETIQKVKLHYLNRSVSVEIFLTEEEGEKLTGTINGNTLKKSCSNLNYINKVTLWKRV